MKCFRRSLPRGYYFWLDPKVAKDQDKKTFSPQGQLPARFFVGRLRSLNLMMNYSFTVFTRSLSAVGIFVD